MRLPRSANEYRREIIKYGERSYTKTIFQGFIYRFLVELLKTDESDLSKKFPDLNEHTLAHLSTFRAGRESSHELSQYSYSGLQDLVDRPLPTKGVGQVLFLGGHMPGSWIASIGAKFGIAPEYFRRHIHLWRSSRRAILYAITTLPSVDSRCGVPLRITNSGDSVRPLGSLALSSRNTLLPERYVHNPSVLTPAPGSTYIRSYAFLDDAQFLIEQDISITIESDGEGWTGKLPHI